MPFVNEPLANFRMKSIIDKEEWDFARIPLDQREACYLYEYERELTKHWPRLSQLFLIRKQRSILPKEDPKAWKIITTMTLIHRVFLKRFGVGLSIYFDFFPHIPWQSLDDTIRSRLVKDVTSFNREGLSRFDRLAIHTLRELAASKIRSIETFARVHEFLLSDEARDQTEYGFFAINWDYGDPEIKNAFESWLTERRHEREKLGLKAIKHRRTARGGFVDKLRWLGALRVRNHYSPNELSDYPDSNLKVDAPYSHLPDLYEAASKAERLLNRLRTTRLFTANQRKKPTRVA